MNYHEDDRAQRLLDVFPIKEGQINISYINSTKHIVAWHNLLGWRDEHGRTRAWTDTDTDWTMQREYELLISEKRGCYVCPVYPFV